MAKSWTDGLNAADEPKLKSSPRTVAPFWRVLDDATPTTKPLTFGAEFVRARRWAEGLGS